MQIVAEALMDGAWHLRAGRSSGSHGDMTKTSCLCCTCPTAQRYRSAMPLMRRVGFLFNCYGLAPGSTPLKRNFTGEVLLQSGIHYKYSDQRLRHLFMPWCPSFICMGCIGSLIGRQRLSALSLFPHTDRSLCGNNSKSLCSTRAMLAL